MLRSVDACLSLPALPLIDGLVGLSRWAERCKNSYVKSLDVSQMRLKDQQVSPSVTLLRLQERRYF